MIPFYLHAFPMGLYYVCSLDYAVHCGMVVRRIMKEFIIYGGNGPGRVKKKTIDYFPLVQPYCKWPPYSPQFIGLVSC